MSRWLDIRAGARARAHIAANGLAPEDVCIVPGAAGGPKGLGLARLDEWLFADWLPQGFANRKSPIELIGASIGAWRFAAVCRGNVNGAFSAEQTRAALQHFAKAYSEQYYPRRVDSAYITRYARELIDGLFVGHVDEVLSHPHYRLNVLAVRGKGILARESPGRTHAGYALAALANAVGRQHLRHFLDRTWFYAAQESAAKLAIPRGFSGENASNSASTLDFDPFKTDYVALSEANFGDALIASGSIPLVLEGVRHIEGASEGTYWDGGIIDYHLHLPFASRTGITLYPHFAHKIVPGWLDKMLPWRKARGEWLDNVLLISPSREYL
ncbi:MAG: patatin-like phospholipase family protein, partial [Burkholderiales bacterium]